MANLDEATDLEPRGDGFVARISPDWCVWSPAGGYLMTLALRAAGRAARFPRPLSVSCHFLAAPKLDEVSIVVESLRHTRVAESLRVSMRQAGRPIIEALVWCGDTTDGYRHEGAEPPPVQEPTSIPERTAPEGSPGFQTLWSHLDHRACGPLHWEHEEPRPPIQRDWIRLRDFVPGADPFLDAGRSALVLDLFTWPAAAHPHAGDARFIAPTIDFQVDFHDHRAGDWVLCDAHSPWADDGRIAVSNRLWSEDRRLLASGSGSLICRPRPSR